MTDLSLAWLVITLAGGPAGALLLVYLLRRLP